jgi:hypothetical protein
MHTHRHDRSLRGSRSRDISLHDRSLRGERPKQQQLLRTDGGEGPFHGQTIRGDMHTKQHQNMSAKGLDAANGQIVRGDQAQTQTQIQTQNGANLEEITVIPAPNGNGRNLSMHAGSKNSDAGIGQYTTNQTTNPVRYDTAQPAQATLGHVQPPQKQPLQPNLQDQTQTQTQTQTQIPPQKPPSQPTPSPPLPHFSHQMFQTGDVSHDRKSSNPKLQTPDGFHTGDVSHKHHTQRHRTSETVTNEDHRPSSHFSSLGTDGSNHEGRAGGGFIQRVLTGVVYVCVRMYICVYIYIYMYVCMYVCMYVYYTCLHLAMTVAIMKAVQEECSYREYSQV